MKFKKLDRRGILNSEISALHSDIQELRMAVTSGEIKGSDGGCPVGGPGKGVAFSH